MNMYLAKNLIIDGLQNILNYWELNGDKNLTFIHN